MRRRFGKEHGDNPRVQSKTTPCFNALCGKDLEQNAGTIHVTDSEHLLVFKASSRDNPEQSAGTIHTSNQEHLLEAESVKIKKFTLFSRP